MQIQNLGKATIALASSTHTVLFIRSVDLFYGVHLAGCAFILGLENCLRK